MAKKVKKLFTGRRSYRTKTGKKRYLCYVNGKLVDNQSYKLAHGQDVKRRAKAEAL